MSANQSYQIQQRSHPVKFYRTISCGSVEIRKYLPLTVSSVMAYPLGMLRRKESYYSIKPNHYIALKRDNAIYCAIPKVACTSIKRLLIEHTGLSKQLSRFADVPPGEQPHLVKFDFVSPQELLTQQYQQVWKFAFVRNPYTRILSCYLNKIGRTPVDGFKMKAGVFSGFDDYYLRQGTLVRKAFWCGMSFSDFVDAIAEIQDDIADAHFLPQYRFLFRPEQKTQVDFIGRFETLQSDFETVRERLSIKQELPRLMSNDAGIRACDYYTAASAEKVYHRFQKDFEIFGYPREVPN